MSHFKSIKLALDTRLNALPGLNDIAWENIKYIPTLNTMYLRPTLLPATADRITLEDIQVNTGIYQIDVIGGANTATASVLDKMDEVYDHFKAELKLEKDDVEVFIRAISNSRLVNDGSRLVGTIQINYVCYNN